MGAVPVGTFWTFAVDHGPAGASCLGCALTTYFTAGPLGGYARDDLTFKHVLCDDRRNQLHDQAVAIAVEVDEAAGQDTSLFKAEPDAAHTVIIGTQATITTPVAFTFTDHQTSGVTGWRATSDPWTFQLINDDGWRICQVDAPDVCDQIVRCGNTEPTTPEPSPSEADPREHLREMLPCGPRDPFPQYHDCPSTTPR